MPPRSRRSKGSTPTHAQSRLSFNNSARVTKPGTRQDDSAKKAASKLSDVSQAPIETEIETPELEADDEESQPIEAQATPVPESKEIDVAIRESPLKPKTTNPKAKRKAVPDKDERELSAEQITDAQIRKYWKAEEDGRLAPRIHQENVSLHEKILRHFDLSSQFGPCIGIQRLQRWKRANMLGLEPPVEVLAVLLREDNKKTSQGCGKLAYIDELAGGRMVLVE